MTAAPTRQVNGPSPVVDPWARNTVYDGPAWDRDCPFNGADPAQVSGHCKEGRHYDCRHNTVELPDTWLLVRQGGLWVVAAGDVEVNPGAHRWRCRCPCHDQGQLSLW